MEREGFVRWPNTRTPRESRERVRRSGQCAACALEGVKRNGRQRRYVTQAQYRVPDWVTHVWLCARHARVHDAERVGTA